MSYGAIMVSRDRPELAAQTTTMWLQNAELPVIVMTEPNQVDAYRAACDPLVEIVPQSKRDAGIAFARHASVLLANERGFDAYIMADDDTVITKGDARELLDFVASGQQSAQADGSRFTRAGMGATSGNSLVRSFSISATRCSRRTPAIFSKQATTIPTRESVLATRTS